jgi:hypothetical protein
VNEAVEVLLVSLDPPTVSNNKKQQYSLMALLPLWQVQISNLFKYKMFHEVPKCAVKFPENELAVQGNTS